jgi:AAA domain, putative AbiEii toxin, Type IV TA system
MRHHIRQTTYRPGVPLILPRSASRRSSDISINTEALSSRDGSGDNTFLATAMRRARGLSTMSKSNGNSEVSQPSQGKITTLSVGLRGNPERTNPVTAVGQTFPGTFESYVASLIQTLPVVVALRAARPGQLFYIEQPEIHLHPRAQVAMARLLVNAATRGVHVVAETHSSLILLAVRTLVAEGVIAPDLVGLNWFARDRRTGTTRIKIAGLDEAGRFGDWPEDFDEVALKSESRYLAAAEARLAGS